MKDTLATNVEKLFWVLEQRTFQLNGIVLPYGQQSTPLSEARSLRSPDSDTMDQGLENN